MNRAAKAAWSYTMQYLARITIHNGSYDEYQDLHKRMQAYGFQRYVKSDDSRHYWLPDATYVGDRIEDGAMVRDQIARIAAACAPSKKAPEVYLCLRGASWWSGLPEIK